MCKFRVLGALRIRFLCGWLLPKKSRPKLSNRPQPNNGVADYQGDYQSNHVQFNGQVYLFPSKCRGNIGCAEQVIIILALMSVLYNIY